METDGLETRCTLSTCRTLDYLPFTCPHCSQPFCSTHKTPSTHSCPNDPKHDVPQVATCPLCKSPVPHAQTVSPNDAVSRHIDAGCPKRKRSAAVCTFPPCNTRDITPTTCPVCRGVFCLSHRLEADHTCTGRPVRGAGPFGVGPSRSLAAFRGGPGRSRSADKGKGKGKEKRKEGGRGSASGSRAKGDGTRRVDFANGTGSPVGDGRVAADERVTLAVYFPEGSGLAARYMYFSQRLSAGRVIEEMERRVDGLRSASEGRYCLYAVKSGGGGVNLLPHITPLRDLGRGVLQSGDAVVLEIGEDGLHPDWIALLAKGAESSRLPSRRSFRAGRAGKAGSKCDIA